MVARTALPSRVRPLLVTDDAGLLDEVLSLASHAGAEVEVAPDPVAARPRYTSAPIVLVGVESARACATARLPRRPGVVLVGPAAGPEPPWDLADLVGAEHIALLPAAAPWLTDRLAMTAGVRPPGRLVAVIGGRGGAGASVLATALAVTAARCDQRALLIDGDPLGGGLDLALGWEGLDGLRWPGLAHTSGPVSPPALVSALPCRGELAVLACDRSDESDLPLDAMVAALDAGRRGRDLVVVDLPRHLNDAAAVTLTAADRVLLVVPAELRACASASRVASAVQVHTDAVSVVVRGPAPGRLRAREIAKALGLPLAGTLRSEPALARGLERGEPPAGNGTGSMAALCRRLLSELGVCEPAVAA
jgi:secretion/DNA translocation related CpaE-like protein